MGPHSAPRSPIGLQPAGQRWGRGARTILPYLSPAVQAKLLALDIAAQEDGPIRNPVFPAMDWALPGPGEDVREAKGRRGR